MKKFTLIAGPCAIEDDFMGLKIAKEVQSICNDLSIDYIFKASYKKANRSKNDSFTGIGNKNALEIIRGIGKELNVDTITDVHESNEPMLVANYVNHLQIPAFLCRQTDLLVAAGKTGLTVNIKKGQFMSHDAMGFAVEKVKSTGNNNVWICERGNSFGYQDLIVDATAITKLKKHHVPVIMDCTHAIQKPNQNIGITGGDPSLISSIIFSAVANNVDGLFIETHPEPEKAKSDPYTMLKLDSLYSILKKAMKIREAIR
ncbi:MAG: 3-deoxy-8-phosphooctulonate synthase [Bacteroidetes bacterium MED-G20]|nr:MAG: 3-deoxy-8-phosphooctulonate synthase [Bacteroidetes bacterium MED-G20]|tara:strand:+ start:858 stop:1634 length:777 start_codon:yes stop_codon:yes gene_type:complete